MKSLKKFERKCMKLHQEFQNSFSNAQSFNKRFEIFNCYIKDFTELALAIKPHINYLNRSQYERRINFFVSDCENEMKIYLTLGTSFYKKCNSEAASLSRFRKRIYKIAKNMKVSEFSNIIMASPSKNCQYKTVSIQHALNSDRVETIKGVLVPYYSTVFDSNLSRILEYCVYIRIHNILIT